MTRYQRDASMATPSADPNGQGAASKTVREVTWNAALLDGDAADAIAKLKALPAKISSNTASPISIACSSRTTASTSIGCR